MRFPNLHIVLHEPVIPQNTGSIARLCACTGATLHLIHPLGFRIDEAAVKRAGLDYWPHLTIAEYQNWNEYVERAAPRELFLFSKFGKRSYFDAGFAEGAHLVFGSETTGLPAWIREKYEKRLFQIPIRTELVRSLNLAQAAAVAIFEAIRCIEAP